MQKLEQTTAGLLVGGATKVILGFVIPITAQLGLGASLSTSAIRGGIAGGIGFITSSILYSTQALPDDARMIGLSTGHLFEALVSGGLYAGTQAIFDLRSQGMLADFTFATISSAAATGIAAPAGILGSALLGYSRREKATSSGKEFELASQA